MEEKDGKDRLFCNMPDSVIRIVNARQNNLQNISVDLPHRALIVVTGPSGSGKSTLAFDTLYAEGQRRYIESLSTYAKQFLDRMPKPLVDRLEGLAPAVAIEQLELPVGPMTFRALAAAQGVLYGLGTAGLLLRRGGGWRSRVVALPAYFCLVNGASLAALWNVVRRREIDRWEPRRSV